MPQINCRTLISPCHPQTGTKPPHVLLLDVYILPVTSQLIKIVRKNATTLAQKLLIAHGSWAKERGNRLCKKRFVILSSINQTGNEVARRDGTASEPGVRVLLRQATGSSLSLRSG